MKPLPLALMIAALAGTAAGGYWLGRQNGATPHELAAAPAATAKPAKKLLYYRNPMGLADTSPVPKKDSMGMDYIAVYEGEDAANNDSGIRVSSEKIQKLGVRSEAATLQALPATLRASARIEVNERGQHVIAPRFEGWVERLHVNTTGQAVAAGQPLFEVYSPDLASAQQEYTLVAGNPNLKGLAEASLTRLRNWGIAESEIKALAAGGTARARPTVTFRAPVSGVVVEKKAVAGMRFMAGEALFQIADLSKVWVVADVSEQDAARLRLGQVAKVQVDALPDSTLQGRVEFIAPLLKNETRTLSVRVELPNPG
ncbi:MAG TPA: efflux RND transporter periplasmic adaptor subunit, partial [Rhodocyclaceae bacterium]